jgi:hypothetical protein
MQASLIGGHVTVSGPVSYGHETRPGAMPLADLARYLRVDAATVRFELGAMEAAGEVRRMRVRRMRARRYELVEAWEVVRPSDQPPWSCEWT